LFAGAGGDSGKHGESVATPAAAKAILGIE
jgi:hypothetical protein